MPLGGKTSVRGSITAKTMIMERKALKPSVDFEEKHVTEPETFDGPVAMVTVGHTVTSAMNYQSITTHVSVQLPSKTDDVSLDRTFERGWAIVEEKQAGRANWVADTLRALNEVREHAER